MDQLEDRGADLRPPVVTQHSFGGLVGPPDDPGLVEDDDHVDVTLDQAGDDGDPGPAVDGLGDGSDAALQDAGRVPTRSSRRSDRARGAVGRDKAHLGGEVLLAVDQTRAGPLRRGAVVGVDQLEPGSTQCEVARQTAEIAPPLAEVRDGPGGIGGEDANRQQAG